jgi:nitrogen fixation/metabolism regulation signal transduction histidine kinase
MYEIIKQTQQLSKTIEDFRNFFKQDKEVQEVLVDEVMQEALDVIKSSFINHSIEVVISYNSKQKMLLFARELMHVFINILNNAKEALVQKNVQNMKISITTKDRNDGVYIQICDNAGGIDKTIFPHIFEPYFTTKENTNGTGLGLYIAKIIVEQHLKGTLHAMNHKDGACFEIILLKESRLGEKQ